MHLIKYLYLEFGEISLWIKNVRMEVFIYHCKVANVFGKIDQCKEDNQLVI